VSSPSTARYEYQHDPAALKEARQRANREADRKAKVTEAPFRPSNPTKKGECMNVPAHEDMSGSVD